jgi:hypothetical protein
MSGFRQSLQRTFQGAITFVPGTMEHPNGIIWDYMALYGTVWHYMVLYSTIRHHLHGTIWHGMALYGTVWHHLHGTT